MLPEMSQDSFNRYVTIGLFVFFGALYLASYITGKPIDWQSLTLFIIPTVNHIVHQITQSQVTTKNIDSKTATTVATIQATGTTNGLTPPQVPTVKP